MERYFGTYQTFRTVSKKDAAVLMGSNTLVGDRYRINLTMDEGAHRAWLINKFNETIGYFDDSFSRELSLFAAEGLELVGILSFVAFTEAGVEGVGRRRDHRLERHVASERARTSPRETTRHGATQNAPRVHRRPRGGWTHGQ